MKYDSLGIIFCHSFFELFFWFYTFDTTELNSIVCSWMVMSFYKTCMTIVSEKKFMHD